MWLAVLMKDCFLKIRGKACYSLWFNKRNLLGVWMLGQNQQANAHVVPVTLNCQPRTKGEISSRMQTSVKVKAFTCYWGHLSYHTLRAHMLSNIYLSHSLIYSRALTHTYVQIYTGALYTQQKHYSHILGERVTTTYGYVTIQYHPITVRQGI